MKKQQRRSNKKILKSPVQTKWKKGVKQYALELVTEAEDLRDYLYFFYRLKNFFNHVNFALNGR